MKTLRKHTALRIFWLLMALHILDFSVDSPDLYPDCIAEDLSINDMESIVEIVLEKVFKLDNAIPEYDEYDDHGSVCKVIDVYVLDAPVTLAQISSYIEYNYPTNWSISCESQYHLQISPPPPKA